MIYWEIRASIKAPTAHFTDRAIRRAAYVTLCGRHLDRATSTFNTTGAEMCKSCERIANEHAVRP